MVLSIVIINSDVWAEKSKHFAAAARKRAGKLNQLQNLRKQHFVQRIWKSFSWKFLFDRYDEFAQI